MTERRIIQMKMFLPLLILVSPLSFAEEVTLPNDAARIRESFGRELERVLVPLHEKYVRALERMKQDYTRNGNLDAALQIDAELARVKLWEGLPIPKPDPAPTQREFGDWLEGRSFSFRGVSHVTLTFRDDLVKWTTSGGEREYPFEVENKREVVVQGAQDFTLIFAYDLKSGTFSSNVGTYDLTFED